MIGQRIVPVRTALFMLKRNRYLSTIVVQKEAAMPLFDSRDNSHKQTPPKSLLTSRNAPGSILEPHRAC
jgi:hypothetical protein